MSRIFEVFDDFKKVDEIKEISEAIVLEEGVKFFRASTRINSYIEKLKRKNLRELDPLIKAASQAADEFERVETRYARGKLTHSEAQLRVHKLKQHYIALIKEIKKEDFKKILKIAGLLVLLGGLIASILFGFHPLQSLTIAVPSLDGLKDAFRLGEDALFEPLRDEIVKHYRLIKSMVLGKPMSISVE